MRHSHVPSRPPPAATAVRATLAALLSLAPCSRGALAQTAATPEFAPDRVVVELRAGAPELPEFVDLASAFEDDPALREALATSGAHAMYRVFRSGGLAPRDPALFAALGLSRHYVVELRGGSDLERARAALAACANLAAVRLDGIVRTTETPNDPLFPQQWDHRNSNDADMDTEFAWDFAKGSPAVIVAVLDTGADLDHPDLVGGLVPGYNFVANNNVPEDDNGHGTFCTGIVGARSNNGIGMAGVAPLCAIMPIKVIPQGGYGTWANVAAGITFAANGGASVLSMSIGAPAPDAGVELALQYAAGLDVLSVAAAGNTNNAVVIYPASSAYCMAIGASSPCDERKNPLSCDGENFWGSCFGPEIDVIAPGVHIPSTAMGGGTTLHMSGTSAAAPHAAGIAALVRALDPQASAAAVRALLQATAEDQVGPPAEDTPGYDVYFGFGRVNAHRAALAALGANTYCTADGTGAPAPCGNPGGADVGARNSTGAGAFLNASGSNSVAQDDLVLRGFGLPANKAALVLMAPAVSNGGLGTPFFDGLLCVAAGGVGVFRHPPLSSSAGGTLALGPGIAAYSCTHFAGQACLQPGSHWNFQCWYRDPTGPCASGANLTNALGVTFRP